MPGQIVYPSTGLARTLRASDGTLLPMGAVADGEYLRRSGTDIVGGTPSSGGAAGPAPFETTSTAVWRRLGAVQVTTSTNPVNNTLRAYLVWLPARAVAKLGLLVSTGQASAKARVGFYTAAVGSFEPQSLVSGSDGGEIDCSGTGILSVSAVFTPTAGWYWFASIDNNTSLGFGVFSGTSNLPPEVALFVDASSSTAAPVFGVQVSGVTYGALPSSWPAGMTLITAPATLPYGLLQHGA